MAGPCLLTCPDLEARGAALHKHRHQTLLCILWARVQWSTRRDMQLQVLLEVYQLTRETDSRELKKKFFQ